MAHYGQPAYPYPGHHQDPASRTSNGLAVAALVLGIAACVFFWTVFGGVLLGLVGLVLGIIAARRARGGRAPHRGMAIVGAVLSALAVIASSVIVAIGVSFLTSDSFKDYNDCVQHADNKSERDQCSKDFERDINGN
ncbi:DUF4190 domain-containing protein [Streptomyces sp. NPDC057621]|uniref:DUF4190 domain-containing protein n=1 Tax=Streptomyces liliiviolaceus TaxID=2823109 RepID=A0A941BA95_9ACTN|nr:DUF4190 domain-containing protein [Streptomyces liliiviolaceus]MBQ0850888.1 DUF4190 domain-containing protein [Streptomyces liliiviolaceus]